MSSRIDDIFARWHEDRATTPDELIAAHPEFADELRARFAALRMLDRAFPGGTPPSQIGEYKILKEIGRGGMGVVYAAEQSSMRRRVALKVLFPSILGSKEAVKRFRLEAWAAGRLKHTNIVAVHQMGSENGVHFTAMELVDGRPLSAVLREMRGHGAPRESRLARRAQGFASNPLSAITGTQTGTRAYYERIAEMFAGVAEALQVAHDHKVIHRDVKPGNLLLDAEGNLRLTDFGLARLDEDENAMTRTGELIGTPLYMSPEQLGAGPALDHRTDIYSFGATLYETLTLHPPFRGDRVAEIAARVLNDDPARPRTKQPAVPRDLETIVLKAIEKDPARRYQNAAAVARDLRRFAEGAAIGARRVSLVERTWRRAKRDKIRLGLAAAVLLGVGCAFWFQARGADAEAALHQATLERQYRELCQRAETATLELIPSMQGHSAAALYSEAIALQPNRPEAYFGRALDPGRFLGDRLADIDAARDAGLSRRLALLARAYILAHYKNNMESAKARNQAQELPREGANELVFEARPAAIQGEEQEARRLLTQALENLPRSHRLRRWALYTRAMVAFDANKLSEAENDLRALVTFGYGSPGVRLYLAETMWRQGEVESAEQKFAALLATLSDLAQWEALTIFCREFVHREWLLRITTAAVRRFPESYLLSNYRAIALVDVHRFTEAHAEALHALQLAPPTSKEEAARNLGIAQVDAGKSTGATMDDRASGVAAARRAHRMLREDLTKESIVLAQRVVEAYPDLGYAHWVLALGHAYLGREKRSLDAVARARRLDSIFESQFWFSILTHLGRAAEAMTYEEKRCKDAPWDDDAWGTLAALLVDSNRPSEALTNADRALALCPSHLGYQCTRAIALSRLDRRQEAIDACETIIGVEPTFGQAYVLIIDTKSELGEDEEALRVATKALGIPGLRFKRSIAAAQIRSLTALGRPAGALKAAEQFPRPWPWRIEYRIAIVQTGRNNTEALAGFRRAEELVPRSNTSARFHIHTRSSMILIGSGRREEALAEIDAAIKVADPGVESAESICIQHRNRFVCLWQLGRRDEALQACRDGIAFDPAAYPIMYISLTSALLNLGRGEEARAAGEDAIKYNPKEARAYMYLGVAHELLGDVDKAHAVWKQLLDLPVAVPDGIVGVFTFLVDKKRRDDATRAYERLKRVAPELTNGTFDRPSVSTANTLAWYLAGSPKLDQAAAVAIAHRTVVLEPGNGGIRNTLGVALYRADEYEMAVEALQKSAELNGKPLPEDAIFLAMAYHKLGKADEAASWYARALKLIDPNNAEQVGFQKEAAALLGVDDATPAPSASD